VWLLLAVGNFIDGYFLPLCLRDGGGLLDPLDDFPSAINNIKSTQGGAAAAAVHHHVSMDFVMVLCNGALYCSYSSSNARVLFTQKKKFYFILFLDL
jgi:hypothetical protein